MENNKTNDKVIIALVGRICAGKGTMSDYLAEKYNAAVLSFSNPMREILRILHQDVTRENLQKLSLAIRTGFGEDVFSKAVKGIAETQTEHIVVLDPIRRSADIAAFPRKSIVMVAVTRDDEGRYQSMLSRNREKNDSAVTKEQFAVLDNAETEIYINDLVAQADYVLENNGTIEELLAKTDNLLATILK